MVPFVVKTLSLALIAVFDIWVVSVKAQLFPGSVYAVDRFPSHRRRDVGVERTEDGHRHEHIDIAVELPKNFRFRHFHGDPVVVYGAPVVPRGPKFEPVVGPRQDAPSALDDRIESGRHSNDSVATAKLRLRQQADHGSPHHVAALAGCQDVNAKLRERLAVLNREIKDLESQLLLVRQVQKLIESQQTAPSTGTQGCIQQSATASSLSAPKRWLSHPTILFKLIQVILGVILMVLQRKYRIVPSLTDQDAILLVQITYSAFLIITPPLLLSYLTSSATQHRPVLHGSLAEVIYLLVGAIMFITCGASFIHNWIDFKPSDFDAGIIDKLPLDVVPPAVPLPFDPREIKSDLKRYREAALALGGLSIANGMFYFLDSWIVVYYMKFAFS